MKTLFTDEDGTHWLVPQNDDYDAIRHLSLFERRCQKYKKYKYKKYNQYGGRKGKREKGRGKMKFAVVRGKVGSRLHHAAAG